MCCEPFFLRVRLRSRLRRCVEMCRWLLASGTGSHTGACRCCCRRSRSVRFGAARLCALMCSPRARGCVRAFVRTPSASVWSRLAAWRRHLCTLSTSVARRAPTAVPETEKCQRCTQTERKIVVTEHLTHAQPK